MLSYKNWKLLEESFGFSNLGIKYPQNLGSVGNLAGLEEAKMKKKMLEDDAEVVKPEEDEKEDEDEEDVADVQVDDADAEVESDDAEETEECGDKKMCCKGMKKKMKKESCDEDEEEEDEEEDEEIEDAEEAAGEDLDGDDEEGEDPDHVAKIKGKTLEMPLLLGMKKKMKKKMVKKMKKEHVDRVASIKEMLSTDPNYKNWDGISVKKEDYLLSPEAPAAAPGPGEVGYAPQTRFGVGSNGQSGDYKEWKRIADEMKNAAN